MSRRLALTVVCTAVALLSACGSSPAARNAPTATAKPTATPRPPLPAANALAFQPGDIPAGDRPHATSIMVLDTRTAVSENLVSSGAALSSGGVLSGFEYGWEDSKGRLAVQNAVFVCSGVPGATFLYNAVTANFKQHMTENAESPPFGDATAAFRAGTSAVVVMRQGRVVVAVETTPASTTGAADLIQRLFQRLQAYDTGSD